MPEGNIIPREKPETLRLKSVSVSITADDLQASLRWYCDVVGFHLHDTYGDGDVVRGAMLTAGDQGLMLTQDDWGKGRDRVKGQGLRLYLRTSQDVDQVAAAIKARGGTLETEPADMPWGSRSFDLVDPDGFLITISS